SPPLTQTILKLAATVSLTSSSRNPSGPGQEVTFTATVTGLEGSAVPTGTVDLIRPDDATLGSGPLDATGVASVTTIGFTTAGDVTVRACYSGDIPYAAACSPPFTQTVRPHPTTTTLVSSH